MALGRVEYGRQVAALADEMSGPFAFIAQTASGSLLAMDVAARDQILAAYADLRSIFPRVRALEPPVELQAAHTLLCAALDRYEEVEASRADGASLFVSGEKDRGVESWHRGDALEHEANSMVRDAAKQIQDG